MTRAFEQSTGLPPQQYLLRQRIERAKTLLVTTDLNVLQIALEAGFTNQSHFTRLFRRIVGVTPTHFRDRL